MYLSKEGINFSPNYRPKNHINELGNIREKIRDEEEWELYVSLCFFSEEAKKCIEDKVFNVVGEKSFNNKTGLYLKRRCSIGIGFANRLFPDILNHPCNILPTFKKELTKGKTFRSEELMRRIKEYSGDYSAHSEVLSLVEMYDSGYRWNA